MFRLTKLGAAAVAVAVALSLAACGGGSADEQKETTLTLGLLQAATSFAAKDMAFANQSPYGQAVFDSLLRQKPTGEVIPGLATEWSYNATKTVLTMTVRNDVTFTDGTKFNADAAAKNLLRFKQGASPDKAFLNSVKDAKALDETHLEITLTDSDPGLLGYLAKNAGMVSSPAAFDKPDLATNPVGSGPYILDTAKTVVGNSYVFTKNPKYWDPQTVHYDKLVLNVYTDPTAMLNAIKGGQLNGAKLANNTYLDQVEAAGYKLNKSFSGWVGLILFDRGGTINPALGDARVRQAINYAFDRDALRKAINNGRGTLTTQIFPTQSAAYDPALDSRYPYDPAKAKDLIAQAGYPNGFTLDMPTAAAVGTALWPIISQQLADVGIKVNYTDAGQNFIKDLLAPKYAASWMQLQQDPDWSLINFQIAPGSNWNPYKYSDPKVNALIEQYHRAPDAATGDAILKQLNFYIVDQAWFAPWYRNENNFATDKNTSVQLQVDNAYPYLYNIVPVG